MNIVTFYVNSEEHPSIWLTEEDAMNACLAYIDELNIWWDSMWPGEVYMDDTYVILDQVTPIPERFGVIKNDEDLAPLPTFDGYEVKELVWDEWISTVW